MIILSGHSCLALALSAPCWVSQANAEPLTITLEDGVIEPLPFAAPTFIAENPGAAEIAQAITQVVAADLAGHRAFPGNPVVGLHQPISSFDAPVAYADWKAINAQALVTGAVAATFGRADQRQVPAL